MDYEADNKRLRIGALLPKPDVFICQIWLQRLRQVVGFRETLEARLHALRIFRLVVHPPRYMLSETIVLFRQLAIRGLTRWLQS